MATYFLHENGQQQGPFSLEELTAKEITKETLIWKEGTTDWVKASTLTELKEYFSKTPPPLSIVPPPVNKPMTEVQKTKKKIGTGGYLIVLVLLCGGAFFIWNNYFKNSDNSSDDSYSAPVQYESGGSEREKTPGEIKEELAEKEMQNPADYLTAEGTYRKNLIDQTVIEGKITNNASVAVFKDVVLLVEFLAPSGTKLGNQKFTKYEIIRPGGSIAFKFKCNAPDETASVNFGVIDAVSAE